MLYAILIHGSESLVEGWSPQEEVLGRHAQLRRDLSAAGQFGAAMRLGPTVAAKVVRGKSGTVVTDGPFAESKEQLLGLYIIDCATAEEALAAAQRLAFDTAAIEVRPIAFLVPGNLGSAA